ncbi:TonB-dependent receptor plug domain-containing protein [Vibrio sp. WXL103]|uniref:TonB-dependent receptor plug domain-containing protein n=1 Tax=Vibrio sp. WXL103 TaxID=3450710 RepID=UPI003EC8631A
MRPTKICTFVMLALFSQVSSAQEHQEIMVITGTKTAKSILDTPIRTEVITAQELERTHATNLSEALQNIPGLTIRNIHGKSGTEISMQGFDGNRVLILVDGMPVSPSTGSTVDLTQLGVANIEQIEIIRGSVSALYGSESMGGVINIITTTPDTPFGFKGTIRGGTYGSRDVESHIPNDANYTINTHFAGDNAYLLLSADHRQLGGNDLDANVMGYDNDSGSKSNYSLTAGYKFNNGGHLKITPSYYSEDVEVDYGAENTTAPGGVALYRRQSDVDRYNLSINYSGPVAEQAYITSYFITEKYKSGTTQSWVDGSGMPTQRDSEILFNKGEFQIDFPIGENHLITTGLVGYQGSLTQTKDGQSEIDPTKPTQENIEFYLQDDYFITDNLELLPGFRALYDTEFGHHFSPKLNLMYSPERLSQYDLKVRAGVGTGYRVPNLKERYYLFDHSHLGYIVLGNPDLEPESSISMQFGIEAKLNKVLSGDINLYRNDTENLIAEDFSHRENGIDIYMYQNQAETFSQGVDLQLNIAETSGWSSSLGYSFLHAEDKQTGNQLAKLPQHQVKGNINYNIALISTELSLYGRYETESFADSANTQKSPAHSVFDFKINTWVTDQFKVFAGVDNLTDTIIDTAVGAGQDFRPTTGRFIYLGLTFDY